MRPSKNDFFGFIKMRARDQFRRLVFSCFSLSNYDHPHYNPAWSWSNSSWPKPSPQQLADSMGMEFRSQSLISSSGVSWLSGYLKYPINKRIGVEFWEKLIKIKEPKAVGFYKFWRWVAQSCLLAVTQKIRVGFQIPRAPRAREKIPARQGRPRAAHFWFDVSTIFIIEMIFSKTIFSNIFGIKNTDPLSVW